MSGWIEEVPALIATMAILILPGLPAAMCLRTSALLRLGASIALSLAIVATASVLAPWFVGWSPVPVACVAAVVTIVAVVLRRLDSRDGVAPGRSPRAIWVALAVAFLAWAAVVAVGIADPAHPSQLYDGLFHLNAVEFIVQNADASPLHMTMVTPGSTSGIYPTLWHAVVALVVPVSGSVVAATNVVTVVVIALIWPVALACLATVVFPTHPMAAVWTPLVAFGFSVFPLGFLTWGVLYPNLLGNVLIPVFLAFLVRAFRSGEAPFGRALWILAAVAAGGASAAAHPSSLLAGIALALPFVIWMIVRPWPSASPRRRVVIATVIVVLCALIAFIWIRANVTTHEWLPNETMGQALGEIALLSPVGRTAGLLLGPLAAIGVWRVVKDRQWWVLYASGVAAAFYLASAWFPILSLRSLAVGVWYDDTTRVGALLAIWGVPLAGLGAAVVAGWLHQRWRSGAHVRAITVGALLAVAAVSHLPALINDLSYMRNSSYLFTAQSQGLSSDEAALFEEVGDDLDEDSVVLGDPLTGAGLLFAYTGHDVVFPHVTGRYGSDAELLARDFAAGGEAVCDAVDRLGVTHVLDFGDRQLFENHWTTFDGLHHVGDSPLVTEVDNVGDATLYRITGCG